MDLTEWLVVCPWCQNIPLPSFLMQQLNWNSLFVIRANLFHPSPSLFIHGLLLFLWCFVILVSYYFQAFFEFKGDFYAGKITQNTVTELLWMYACIDCAWQLFANFWRCSNVLWNRHTQAIFLRPKHTTVIWKNFDFFKIYFHTNRPEKKKKNYLRYNVWEGSSLS